MARDRPADARVHRSRAADVRAWLDGLNGLDSPAPRVLSFLGYSAAGYEDAAAMQRVADQVLAEHDPRQTVVNIGATPDGIGAVYALARRRGFRTIGIVSSRALDEAVAWSPDVERIFVVDDARWGGLDGAGRLSPTSAALVALSDTMVAIGGNGIARDELLAGRAAGKRVRFVPADADRALALARARSKGLPAPETGSSALGTEAWSAP